MKGYELVFITDPVINDKELESVMKRFKKNLKDFGGKIIQEHVWGKRRLAYEIKGNDYGVYHAWYFTGTGKTVDELQRQFGYSDNILRNQIVKINDINEESSFFSKLIDSKEIIEKNNNAKEVAMDDSNVDSDIKEVEDEKKQEIEEKNTKSVEKIDS